MVLVILSCAEMVNIATFVISAILLDVGKCHLVDPQYNGDYKQSCQTFKPFQVQLINYC